MIVTQINIDLAGLSRFEYVIAKQADADSRLIQVQLLDNGKIYVLDNLTTARVSITKPDKTEVINDCTISNNMIEIVLDANMLAVAGTAVAEIILTGSAGDVLTSASFDIKIIASATGKGAESSSEYNSFKNALAAIDNIDARFKQKADGIDVEKLAADMKEVQETGVTAEVVEAKVEATIDEMIADGTMAGLTLEDGSIKEEKLSEEIVEKLNSAGYVVGADGNKYSVTVDEKGNVNSERIFEVPTEGLIVDVQVKGGAAVEVIQGLDVSAYTVNADDSFNGDGKTNLVSGLSLDSFTLGFWLYRPLNTSYLNICDVGMTWNSFSFAAFENNAMNTMYGGDLLGAYWVGEKESHVARLKAKTVQGANKYVFLAFSKDNDNRKLYVVQNGIISEKDFTVETAKALATLICKTQNTYKRVLVYDRTLKTNELEEMCKCIYEYEEYTPNDIFPDGITGLGSCGSIVKKSFKPAEWWQTSTDKGEQMEKIGDVERTFTNNDFENPTVEEDSSFAEAIYFIHFKDTIKIGEMYAVEAMPYPYNVKQNSYNVEYSSSDSSVVECYQGVLIPKAAGKATITAKLSNSDLTVSKDITIEEAETESSNICEVPENYCYGVSSLQNASPVCVADAFRGAILQAVEMGYDGIRFPQGTYNVKFTNYDDTDTFIHVPSNFIIDFNNSVWNIIPRDDATEKGIVLFRFGKSLKWDSALQLEGGKTNGGYEPLEICENSKIKNLTIYGERYNTTGSSNYKGSGLFRFGQGARHCKIENVHTEGMTGWLVDANCNDYNYWSGLAGRSGRTYYTDYQAGKLDETGTNVVEDETGTWFCTPEFLEVGYVYEKDSIHSTGMDKYKFGRMGIVTYGNSGRWYDIYFYDEEKNLISYNPHQYGLEPYQLPENAVYFKVNVPFGEAPTANTGEDACLIRLYPYQEPTDIVFENCTFVNTEYTCFSMTGGVEFVIKDCFVEAGTHSDWNWAIDWEDGWQAMRHCIHYHVISNGAITFPGGHHMCVISCLGTGLSATQDTEASVILNSIFDKISCKAKTNEFFENVHYKTSFTKEYGLDAARIREVNNVQETSWII